MQGEEKSLQSWVSVGSVIWLSIAVCAGVVLTYAAFFSAKGYAFSDKVKDWNDFASFFTSMLGPLFSMINLWLVAYIAINLNTAVKTREVRLQQTAYLLERQKEWNSTLYECRARGDAALRSEPKVDLLHLYLTSPEVSKDIWLVLGFFHTLEISIQNGLADERMAVDLFGAVFVWWEIICIRGQYPPVGDSYYSVTLFAKRVKNTADPHSYETWVAFATNDLTLRQQS